MNNIFYIKIKTLIVSFTSVALVACGSAKENDEIDSSSVAAPSRVSVVAEKVTRADVQTWVFSEGTARALKREFLSFEGAGRITYVDPSLREGGAVKKGQLIAYQEKNRPMNGNVAKVDSLSHSSVRDAQANLDLAQKTYSRFKKLLEQNSASQQEYDEAEAKFEQAKVSYQNAQDVADESRIVSPIDGVIARLNIEQGYYFSPSQVQSTSEAGALNTVPVVIIDPSKFELTVSLPSFYYQQLKVDSPVLFQQDKNRINLSTQANQVIDGFVYAISPSIDPETRTFLVKLRSNHGAEYLQDGEYLSAWIAGSVAKNTLAIPMDSTRFENNKPYVFKVNKKNNVVSKTFIELGLEGKNKREVLDGLMLGDIIVTEGRSRLSDGDVIHIIDNESNSSKAEAMQ